MKARNSTKSAIAKKIKPTHLEISRLAHSLYERAGKPDGKALEHWFNAEAMAEANFGYGKTHTEHDFSMETEAK